MRRTVGWASLVLGLTLLFLAPLLRWYTVPRVQKAPTDVYERIVSVGFGRYLSVKTFSVTNTRPLENIMIAKGIPGASTRDVAVVSLFQRTIDVLAGEDIDYQLDTYALDRDTGYAVHCCGERPRHEGVTLKFPFGTRRSTYPFYDSTAHRAFPARYVRQEDIGGVLTYVFESHVPDTGTGTIDNFPGFLARRPKAQAVKVFKHYSADTTVWVEPVTGAVVRAAQHAIQWAADARGGFLLTLADTNLAYDRPTVQAATDSISSQVFQLRMVSVALPVYGPIAALALIILSAVLLRWPKGGLPDDAAPDG